VFSSFSPTRIRLGRVCCGRRGSSIRIFSPLVLVCRRANGGRSWPVFSVFLPPAAGEQRQLLLWSWILWFCAQQPDEAVTEGCAAAFSLPLLLLPTCCEPSSSRKAFQAGINCSDAGWQAKQAVAGSFFFFFLIFIYFPLLGGRVGLRFFLFEWLAANFLSQKSPLASFMFFSPLSPESLQKSMMALFTSSVAPFSFPLYLASGNDFLWFPFFFLLSCFLFETCFTSARPSELCGDRLAAGYTEDYGGNSV